VLVEGRPDAASAQPRVDAEIVDVERPHVGEHVVALVPLRDAEGVPSHHAPLVHGDEDGARLVAEHPGELVVGVLARPGAEQVGTSRVMDGSDLDEQLPQAWDVTLARSPYLHGQAPLRTKAGASQGYPSGADGDSSPPASASSLEIDALARYSQRSSPEDPWREHAVATQ
jgi:hypothetical protein